MDRFSGVCTPLDCCFSLDNIGKKDKAWSRSSTRRSIKPYGQGLEVAGMYAKYKEVGTNDAKCEYM
jgi:hypothetical protein